MISLTFTIALGIMFSEDLMPDQLLQRLPLEWNGWQRHENDYTYDRESLYEYINGGAELYLSYGFRKMAGRIYQHPDQPDIIVDIFDMDEPENAYGVFTQSREMMDESIGMGSQYTAGLLLFWKDRYYVSLLCSPENDTTRAAVMQLGRVIAGSITHDGQVPDIRRLLPGDDLIPASVRYFRHHLWLNTYYFIARENLLNIAYQSPAILGKYRDNSYRLLVSYQNPDTAGRSLGQFIAHFAAGRPEDRPVRLEDDTWLGCRRLENYVLVVLNMPEEQFVLDALDDWTEDIRSY